MVCNIVSWELVLPDPGPVDDSGLSSVSFSAKNNGWSEPVNRKDFDWHSKLKKKSKDDIFWANVIQSNTMVFEAPNFLPHHWVSPDHQPGDF